MTNEDKDKKEYELGVLLANEDDIAKVLTLIAQHNGEIVGEPHTKNITLAYEIKGKKEAVFASCLIRSFGDDVKALEHDLSTGNETLRALIVIAETFSDRTSSAFGSRERRGRPAASRPVPAEAAKASPSVTLSNEALEKKIEEILK